MTYTDNMDLSGLGVNGTHVMPDPGGHQIQLDRPALVIAAINLVLPRKVK